MPEDPDVAISIPDIPLDEDPPPDGDDREAENKVPENG